MNAKFTNSQFFRIHSALIKKYKEILKNKGLEYSDKVELHYGFNSGVKNKSSITAIVNEYNAKKRVTSNGKALYDKLIYFKKNINGKGKVDFLRPYLFFLDCNTLEEFEIKHPEISKKFKAHYFSKLSEVEDVFDVEIFTYEDDPSSIKVQMSGFHSRFKEKLFSGEGKLITNDNGANWVVHMAHGDEYETTTMYIPSHYISNNDFLEKNYEVRVLLTGIDSNQISCSTICTLIDEKDTERRKLADYYNSIVRNHTKLILENNVHDGKVDFEVNGISIIKMKEIANKKYRVLVKTNSGNYIQSMLLFKDSLIGHFNSILGLNLRVFPNAHKCKIKTIRLTFKDKQGEEIFLAFVSKKSLLKDTIIHGPYLDISRNLEPNKFSMIATEKEYECKIFSSLEIENSDDNELKDLYHCHIS